MSLFNRLKCLFGRHEWVENVEVDRTYYCEKVCICKHCLAVESRRYSYGSTMFSQKGYERDPQKEQVLKNDFRNLMIEELLTSDNLTYRLIGRIRKGNQ